jgi:hypothetical protein
MNPQPDPYIGQLISVLFFMAVLYFTFKSYHSSDSSNMPSDLFTIGYIEESTNVPVVNVKTEPQIKVEPVVKIIQNEQKKLPPEANAIYTDCVDALRALGMKKTEAVKRTKDIFTNLDNPPTTVQGFLMIALRNK